MSLNQHGTTGENNVDNEYPSEDISMGYFPRWNDDYMEYHFEGEYLSISESE